MTPRVALIMHPTAMLFESAIAAEVFGVDRGELSPNGRWYDFIACTRDGRPHRWLPEVTTRTYRALAGADTVVVSSADPDVAPEPELIVALQRAHDKGTRIISLCTGAFVLAAAGLLDGRSATTHWMHAADLARRRPQIDVRPDVLYVDDGDVLTSAGKSAALDLCLHVVGLDFGAAAANGVARRLVAPSHRRGGQAQFITPPAAPPTSPGLTPTLEWALGRLDCTVTVVDLARHAGLSTRQLARRMHVELDRGPLEWLQEQRLMRARELLERTDISVDRVATNCGLGTAATLRRHFHRELGVTPTAYRTTFRHA